MAQGGWFVPLEYVLAIISAFVGVIGLLWFGVVVRVFVNNERRLTALETYADPRNEETRNRLLIAQFKLELTAMELRLGNNLEAKRSSIESAISQVGEEVVKTIKNGGA